MAGVHKTKLINVPADKVWAWVKDFPRIVDIFPQAPPCKIEGEGIGQKRIFAQEQGPDVIEVLDAIDEDNMALDYSLTQGMPVKNYTGVMKVIPKGDSQCEVDWRNSFEPDGMSEEDLVKMYTGYFEMALEELRKLFEN